MKYIILADDGETVEVSGEATIAPDEAIIVDTPLTPRQLVKHRYVDGVFIERPALSDLTFGNDTYEILDVPIGTEIVVYDVIGGEEMTSFVVNEAEYNLQIQLTVSGEYAVELNPPPPFLPAFHKIEVS